MYALPLSNICDHLCINWPFRKTLKSSFLRHPLTELMLIMTMFSFSIQLIVLKLYDSECDSVENVDFEKCLFQFCIVLRLSTEELIALFSMNTYKVSGPNFASRCVVECRCKLWHKCKIDQLCQVSYSSPYWKIAFCGEWESLCCFL